ncbi:MAG: ECF transporter S component [Clostridiales bacterium]|jgi:energy-coupling factor transport system substrate-specific component|nr:ECF transporter S component [Clostridiales bacterium]
MKNKNVWSIKLSTASLVLIPAAVGVNYIGKLFAQVLKLPLWLDSIGTVLASMLAGPIIGALAGLINNIIYGFMDPVSFVYGITGVAIGVAAGLMARLGFLKSWGKATVMAFTVVVTATVVSTPINIIFWEGQTGNVWGDVLYAAVLNATKTVWLASFLDELIVDLPDKILTVLISYAIYRGLPKNLLQLYFTGSEIEELK